jgi:excisionase family DNA binding protein
MSNFSTETAPLVVVKPKAACRMLGCGITRLYELLASGQLSSFRDGASRKIEVASIHRYISYQMSENDDASTKPQPRRRGRPRKAIVGSGS